MSLNKFIVGSKCACIKDFKDLDILIVDETEYKEKNIFRDYKVISKDKLLKTLDFSNFYEKDWLFNYQYDAAINPDFSKYYEYHILDHKDKLYEFLKLTIDKEKYNFNKNIRINNKYLSKLVYHIAYNIFILENNSILLNINQIDVINKIHDLKMPFNYIDELIKTFNNIKL